MGDVGAGASMKIVHNTLLTLYWRAAGEALSYGAAAGLAMQDMVGVIGDSFAAAKQWPLKVPVLLGEDAPAGFDLAGLAQEVAVTERLFAASGVPHDLLSITRADVQDAVAEGWGARDVAALALYIQARAQS
jgi:3-hydroxyisobutyrate dehydrogenase